MQDDVQWPFIDPRNPSYRAPEAIEARAREFLSMGLESGRVAAVVGAGCSIAYGRVSWQDLVKAQYEVTLKLVKDNKGAGSAHSKLIEAFNVIKPNMLESGLDLPSLLDQTRVIYEAIRETNKDIEESGWIASIQELAGDDIRPVRSELLEVISDPDLQGELKSDAAPRLRRDILADLTKSGDGPVNAAIKAALKTCADDRSLLPPLRRYALIAAVGAAEARGRRVDIKAAFQIPKPPSDGKSDRAALLPEERDPLLLLNRRLRITRYMTTNYDREIERMFESEGYQDTTNHANASPWTPRFDRFVFGRDSATKLIDFAARRRGHDGLVAYLHGRLPDPKEAEKEQKEQKARAGVDELIVTERDYQRLYLRDEKTRDLMDAAMDMAFSASPLLFLGSNMNEGDLLHPLRRLMSQGKGHGERPVVALLPGWDSKPKRLIEQQKLLSRFGVHVLYFGSASFKGEPEVNHDWLYGLSELKTKLNAALKGDKGQPAKDQPKPKGGAAFDIKKQPNLIESIPVKELDVEFDLEIIRQVAGLALGGKITKGERAALTTLVDGAFNSIVSACACAKILAIEAEWKAWKGRLSRLPTPRTAPMPAPMPAPEDAPKADMALIFERNALDLQLSDVEDPTCGPFYADSPSVALQDLANRLEMDSYSKPEVLGRRIVTLVGGRGLGKGHLFDSIDACVGVESKRPLAEVRKKTAKRSRLLNALRVQGGQPNAVWVGYAFVNLSFAHEVMSAFDGLMEFLSQAFEKTIANDPIRTAEHAQAWRFLRQDRVERLKYVLRAWSQVDVRKDAPDRLLVVFNHLGILFDRHGKAKNGQVWRLFEVLTSELYGDAPIDLIFICDEGRVPASLRADGAGRHGDGLTNGGARSRPLWPPYDGGRSTTIARHTLEGLGFTEDLATPTQTPRRALTDGRKRDCETLIHILRGPRASLVMLAYFPRLSILLAREILKGGPNAIKGGAEDVLDPIFQEHAGPFRTAMKTNLNDIYRSETVGGDPGVDLRKAGDLAPIIAVVLAALYEANAHTNLANKLPGADLGQPLEACLKGLVERLKTCGPKREELYQAAAAYVEKPLKGSLTAREIERATGQLNAYLKRLYESMNGGRYLLTLACSGAYALTADLTRAEGDGLPEILRKDVNAASTRVKLYFDNLMRSLEGRRADRAHEVVLPLVRDLLRTRHDNSARLPFTLKNSKVRKGSPQLYKLMHECVWHLAIIGEPVSAKVLMGCPSILAAAKEWNAGKPVDPKAEKPTGLMTAKEIARCLKSVQDALDLARAQCLVFVLRSDEAGGPVRYAVHRFMQRDVLRSLGAVGEEFADIDQFTLTIYASQPDNPPTITSEAHETVMEAIKALAAYPDARERHPAAASDKVVMMRLRAAFSVLRTVYSIGAISRLAMKADLTQVLNTPGKLEDHRQLLWWMINKAIERNEQDDDGDVRDKAPPPFYAEEIVWLYNEVGVLSLIQGRLSHAQTVFECALMAAKRIERDEEGALHVRLVLNRATTMIERGQLNDARSDLYKISHLTSEHPVPRLLATGYLGVLEHIAGDAESARQNYTAAISGLHRSGRHRAVSIFSRHLGDLERGSSTATARQILDQARTMAAKNGHIDVEQLCDLSQIRLEMADGPPGAATVIPRLDQIELYAGYMDAPRLEVLVQILRARLYFEQGDHSRAAKAACNSRGLAAMHDMRLRNDRSAELLKQIYAGWPRTG